ncbi:MAG: ATP-binding protein [Planctomycetota bacterium]
MVRVEQVDEESQQRDLAQVNQALEARLRELEATNATLTAARDEAEAANRAKSRSLAELTHEIRAPANGLMGMTDLLDKTSLTQQQRLYVDMLKRSAVTLRHVIDDVLDLSSMEAGRLEMVAADFDIRDVIDDVLETMGQQAQRKGLELVAEYPPVVLPGAHGDLRRTRQVLVNLIGNAVKFTSEGVVRVRLLDGDGVGELRVEVEDTGIGIGEDARAKIFEPFTQADGSTSREFGGSGLGLSISKGFVEAMGGRIGVAAPAGRGAKLWFTLPRGIDDSGESMAVPGLDVAGSRAGLLVKHPAVSASLRAALAGCGVDATELPDGAAVGPWLRGGPDSAPVVLIADAHGLSAGPDVPLVALRRLDESASWSGAASHGGRQPVGLHLPVTRQRLLAALRGALGLVGAGAGRGARTSAAVAALRGLRVLVAEDSPVNQEVTASMLQLHGCHVDLVTNGEDAVDAVRHRGYHVVLMDWQMPGLDGLAATARIRAAEAAEGRQATPIVALSARAMPRDDQQCLEAGADGYLSKPFSEGQLLEILAPWAASVRGRSDAPTDVFDVLDAEALDRLRSLQRPGTRGFVERILGRYVGEVDPLIRAIRQGAEGGDLAAIERAAHTLKSSSLSVGAAAMGAVCANLEKLARTGGDGETLLARLPELLRAAAEVRAEVARVVAAANDDSGVLPGPS